jgi:hypothetical protein
MRIHLNQSIPLPDAFWASRHRSLGAISQFGFVVSANRHALARSSPRAGIDLLARSWCLWRHNRGVENCLHADAARERFLGL